VEEHVIMMSIIVGEAGEKRVLLGNEAIARGVVEAGVGFVASYPGTPSTEIVDTLAEVAKVYGIHVEWSTNEKTAYESAFAASVCGVRAFFSCKHVGVNVAADAIATSAYVGTRAGFVFVSADDPYCHSSQNEQDTRWYARLFGLICLEPSTPQEAKDFVIMGYDISEKTRLPVMIRETTRLAHSRGVVTFGSIRERKTVGFFEKDPFRFVVVPAVARKNHVWLIERLEKAKQVAEEIGINKVIDYSGKSPKCGRLGIITSGVAFTYVHDALQELGITAKVLKLGFTHPLPEKTIVKFLENVDTALIVEEVDPVLETDIKAIAKEYDVKTKILGKKILPRVFELRPEQVREAIIRAANGEEKPIQLPTEPQEFSGIRIPKRLPVLCPGCPHRASYYVVKRALRELGIDPKKVIFPTDIGCYTLGFLPPYNMGDFLLCMGSSSGSSSGFSAVAKDQYVIAFIGDSTFYHAGIPGIINAVWNNHPFMLCVLDNQWTAMTGFQPTPSTPPEAIGVTARVIKIEDIARAIGAKVFVSDPVLEWKKTKELFKKAIEEYKKGNVVVFVFRHSCALMEVRRKGRAGMGAFFEIDREKCINCGICYRDFNCPAIVLEGGKPKIRQDLCTGCGVCWQICPVKAIKRVK